MYTEYRQVVLNACSQQGLYRPVGLEPVLAGTKLKVLVSRVISQCQTGNQGINLHSLC